MAREIKIEEKRSESRLNNIVILGAPEKDNPDQAERNKVDQALVEELLKALEIKEAPEKSYRVGAY